MTEQEAVRRAIEGLRDIALLAPEQLAALSHLDREAEQLFRREWESLPADRRRQVLIQLNASERENLRQDFNAIYQVAFEDPDPAVRKQAVDSIVEDTSLRLLDNLTVLATEDPDPRVRESAVRALAPFARRGELGEIDFDRAAALERTLLGVLHRAEEPTATRGEALAALGYFDNERIAQEIRSGLDQPELRRSAVVAIGRSANPDWASTLAEQAASDEDELREEAARACGEIADEQVAHLAVDLVDDPVLKVRLAAIAALGQIGGEDAREALIYALEDKREVIREAAEQALAQLEPDEDPLSL